MSRMRSVLRSATLLLPPIRELYKVALRAGAIEQEAERLRGAVARSESQAASLRAETAALRDTVAALKKNTESSDGAATELLRANAERRLIVTEYPYFPQSRPIADRPGGRLVIERFERNIDSIRETILGIAKHSENMARIPYDEEHASLSPYWHNDWFPPFDGASLYGLIAERKPRRYIEVGSGISTRFARRAIQDYNLPTQIVSIDPHPHNATDGLCDETIVRRAEDLPTTFWSNIDPGDILFIDNSHRCFPGSDVTVFFTEVLPGLSKGVIYGIHDIFLPNDYPDAWNDRYYSEQYLLMMYLLGGARDDKILSPNFWAYSKPELHGLLDPLWSNKAVFRDLMKHGGCFWAMRD